MRNLHYMKVDLKTVQDFSNPDIKECPYCGNDEYYIHQRISGRAEFKARYDGEEADNGHLHNGLDYTDIGKFAYCTECRKRVFRFRK